MSESKLNELGWGKFVQSWVDGMLGRRRGPYRERFAAAALEQAYHAGLLVGTEEGKERNEAAAEHVRNAERLVKHVKRQIQITWLDGVQIRSYRRWLQRIRQHRLARLARERQRRKRAVVESESDEASDGGAVVEVVSVREAVRARRERRLSDLAAALCQVI